MSDDFRICATAIVILCLLSTNAFASYDLNLNVTARSYPLAGGLEADVGYDFLLWGETTNPFYGYLRPHFTGTTSGSYNAAAAAVDFYPLAFLGARAGGEAVQNDADYSAYDCVSYICRGRFYRTFAQGELTLGAGPFFVQGRVRRERWTEGTSSPGAFIEPTSGLALLGTGDAQTVYRGMAGLKLGATWSMAGVVVYSQSDEAREVSRISFGLIRYTAGSFSAGLGGGVYSSTLKKEGAAGLAFLNWNIKPSLALN